MDKEKIYRKLNEIFSIKEFEDIAAGMVSVENFLLTEVASKAPKIFQQEVERVIKAGGKRLRPLLVMISGHIGHYKPDFHVKAASCVELIHTASLIHDDIIDRSDMRRGDITTRSLLGDQFAVSAGDYLFAVTFKIASELGSMKVLEILAFAAEELSLGEFDGQKLKKTGKVTTEDYLKLISRKTASLFRASCEIGAILSDALDEEVEAASEFGYLLGMAFQMLDDILDITGSSDILGKPAGSDLREGFITLPFLLAIEDGFMKEEIVRGAKGELEDSEIEKLILKVVKRGYAEEARKVAFGFLEKAIEVAQKIRNPFVVESFTDVGNYVVQRYY